MKLLVGMPAVLLIALNLSAQERLPAGTVLPVQLSATVSSRTSHPGDRISARIMQQIRITPGFSVPAGSRVEGKIVNVVPASQSGESQATLRFDRVVAGKRVIPILADLRAIASFREVEEAQLPAFGGDRGTSSAAYTTVQIGGHDVVYRGGGPVMEGSEEVGVPVPDGVLAEVRSSPGSGCRGPLEFNSPPQSLWLFSSDACGSFGFPDLKIARAGRRSGEIVLTAARGLRIPKGSGLLLRVTGAQP